MRLTVMWDTSGDLRDVAKGRTGTVGLANRSVAGGDGPVGVASAVADEVEQAPGGFGPGRLYVDDGVGDRHVSHPFARGSG